MRTNSVIQPHSKETQVDNALKFNQQVQATKRMDVTGMEKEYNLREKEMQAAYKRNLSYKKNNIEMSINNNQADL
ncbi:hypothetical protein [Motiliproteus sp. MSK22-1]|uniref:hypothetical protein n=1 Tax=Motiliproteus sp. MSK22-1 TaxID=1897630 RepID=UPI000975BC0F|nr:hypothetical protein [Motiliproteus sp. MSK22-1]OMH25245.1 hypothetical protein BGP75_25920 [Motiliproteus sp. MSK22-1]